MRVRYRLSHLPHALAALASVIAVAESAGAQSVPACASLGDGTHVVYVAGSSAVQNALGPVAAALAAQTPSIQVVYVSQGSCVGDAYMTGASGDSTDTLMPGSGVTPITFDSTGAPTATGCTLDQNGVTIDIGVSDVFAASCGVTVASTVHDFHGFNQTMQFAVPVSATATAITAEAAYMVYGFGAATGKTVTPWNDPTEIWQRGGTSGTQAMLAAAINVPSAKWLPSTQVAAGGTNGLAGDLTASVGAGKANQAIGILAADYTNAHSDTVKVLAFQAYGQSCAYLPDSKAGTFDKQNVRDGHYAVWGPLHLYAFTSGGKAVNADAQTVIDALSFVNVPPSVDLVKLEATHGVVPDCAMKVSRTSEVGELASYQPTGDCTCKFVKEATGTAPADCHTCTATTGTVDTTCPAGRNVCNYGFCEVK